MDLLMEPPIHEMWIFFLHQSSFSLVEWEFGVVLGFLGNILNESVLRMNKIGI